MEEDLLVVEVKGTVPLRNLAHGRPDCGNHAFKQQACRGNHTSCAQCFCFVCDVEASECEYWGTGARNRDHCNAHASSHYWLALRKLARKGTSHAAEMVKAEFKSRRTALTTNHFSPADAEPAPQDKQEQREFATRLAEVEREAQQLRSWAQRLEQQRQRQRQQEWQQRQRWQPPPRPPPPPPSQQYRPASYAAAVRGPGYFAPAFGGGAGGGGGSSSYNHHPHNRHAPLPPPLPAQLARQQQEIQQLLLDIAWRLQAR